MGVGLTRRGWLSAVLAGAAGMACGRRSEGVVAEVGGEPRGAAGAGERTGGAGERTGGAGERASGALGDPWGRRWRRLYFPATASRAEAQRAEVLGVGVGDEPVLIALHGRGETRSLEAGAGSWRVDYEMGRGDARLRSPPLVAEDLKGFVRPARLEAINAALRGTPYRGVRVVSPFTPDLIRAGASEAAGFASFLIEELLPAARGGGGRPERTGIDGVSLGGRLSLLVGLSHPEIFGAVGAMQPAVRRSEVPAFVALAVAASRVRAQVVRLVTSQEDPFRPVVHLLGEALAQAGVAHAVQETPGPHDYAWNQGPGSVETLLWYDRVLRGEPGL